VSRISPSRPDSRRIDPEQLEAPYLNALMEYAARHPGRFNVPGHKGGPAADPLLVEAFGIEALEHDIPALIEGIDAGPEPTPFTRAQRLAAKAWGAQRSWFLVNGGSQGNHAACLALRHSGRRVAVQRNVHSSTIDGLILAGLEPTFVPPVVDAALDIAHCVTPEALDSALAATSDAVGAMVVSPTYFGAIADVAALADVAHSRGVPLLVDEAWGAHLRFSDELPRSALECGADLVLSSVHKLVGSLTQSAILHLGNGGRIDENVVDRSVTLVESTSPNALLAGSLDAARRHAAVDGPELLSETVSGLRRAREAIREIPGLEVLDEHLTYEPGVYAFDPLRLSIDVRGTGVTGHRMAALLRELDDIYLELSSDTVIVAVFGIAEPAEEGAARIVAALRHAVAELGEPEMSPSQPFAAPPPWGPLELSPREAFLARQEAVPLGESAGRIAAESLAAYPPGVPNVLPGERISSETVEFIRDTLSHGGTLRGAADRTLETVRVVVERRSQSRDVQAHRAVSGKPGGQ
jgi:arginine decarboxylase